MFDDKIAVKNERELIFIPLNEITFICATKNYCEVHTISRRRYLQQTSMEASESQQLKGMLRISETTIINITHLACNHSENGSFNTAEMDDCNEFEISPDWKPQLMARIKDCLLGGS